MSAGAAPACEVEGLCKRFGEREALADVTFAVPPGALLGLLGPNGGGKTTLFRILATLLKPTAGTASVAGHSVVREPEAVRRALGVVFQSASLDKKLTCRENLAYHGALYGLARAGLDARIRELFERFQLADRAGDLAETLSGGLQRRLDLCRGLLHRPRVLLLDEPTTGLDPGARRDLWRHLDALRAAEGTTILVTTHLLEEADGCDRVAILDRGRLVAQGAPADLKAEIGGDVITITAEEPEALGQRVEAQLGAASQVVDGKLRLERADGHRFIPQLIDAFPGEIQEVTFSRPTLEDVFLRKTGRAFVEALEVAP